MGIARVVATPDGEYWVVERVWGRPPRWRWTGATARVFQWWQRQQGRASVREGLRDELSGGATPDVAVGLGMGMFIGAPFIVLGLLVWAVVGALCFAFETLVYAGRWLGHVVLRRPFVVRATHDGEMSTVRVIGWRRSGRAAAEFAETLERGGRVALTPHVRKS